MVVIKLRKHAGETIPKGFDLTAFSTNFWRPGMAITADFCIRPAPQELADALGYTPRLGPDGYQYRASINGGGSVGMTGTREPRWDATIDDGSITWTREPISADSLFRSIDNPGDDIEWIVEPDTLVITAANYIVGTAIQVVANIGGGIEGAVHRAIARVTYSDASIQDYAIDVEIVDDEQDV